jgi:Protein of unknown function (DUF2911)
MIKKIFIGVIVVLLAIAAYMGYNILNPKSPGTTTSYSKDGFDIKVTYSQPYKKGRLIFGEEKDKALQPYGKYWRLGANAATEITFNKDVNFAGKPVKAGSYRMYAVPGPTSFQVSLNSETGVFLAAAEPDYTKDVLKVDVPVTNSDAEVEQFVIKINDDSSGAKMDFVWDRIVVSVPISVQ